MYDLLLNIETLWGGGGILSQISFKLDLGFKLVKLHQMNLIQKTLYFHHKELRNF